MKNNFLKNLLHPILKKNEVFKNKFKGETCYIFGNGASLKYVDFKNFQNHPSIGINHLILHKEFNLLDICCYTLPEPMSFYPYYKNPYKLKYEKNIMGSLFRSQMIKFPNIKLFTSFTNILGTNFRKTYYLHHFGKKEPDVNYLNLCSEFSYLAGGLYAGIGLAISLGFKKAILVGCDYLMKPKTYGHFYSQPREGNDYGLNPYNELLDDCLSMIDLEAISINAQDSWIPCTDYKKFTGVSTSYRENTEIISRDNLMILNEAYKMRQYPEPILPKDFN
jgi:hypothetical protein